MIWKLVSPILAFVVQIAALMAVRRWLGDENSSPVFFVLSLSLINVAAYSLGGHPWFSEPALSPQTGPQTADINTARRVFHLIHGTWAMNASWIHPGSSLSRTIASESSDCVLPFEWSGLNSPWLRRRAAMRLARDIMAIYSENPRARQFVVAHSHGGNIAMLAQAQLRAPDAIAGIVTLSTPFIQCRPRPLGTATLVAVCFGLGLFIALGGWWEGNVSGRWTVSILVLLTVWCCGGAQFAARKVAHAVKSVSNAPPRLLAMRMPADEASAAFGAGHLGTWFLHRALTISPLAICQAMSGSRKLSGLLRALPWAALIGASLGLTAAGLRGALGAQHGPLPHPALLWVATAIIVSPTLLPFIYLPVVCVGAIPFGLTAVLVAPVLEMTAEAAPAGHHEVWQSGFPDDDNPLLGLRHSALYGNATALSAMKQWIDRLSEGAADSSRPS